jgi:hypothetical protein
MADPLVAVTRALEHGDSSALYGLADYWLERGDMRGVRLRRELHKAHPIGNPRFIEGLARRTARLLASQVSGGTPVVSTDPTDASASAEPLHDLLPAWFTTRMMTDTWTFGLLLVTGQTLVISTIHAIHQDAAGDLWLDVELATNWPGERDGFTFLAAPVTQEQRLRATVSARNVVAAFDLEDS